MRLFFVLSMCLVLSGSANAVKLSQSAQRYVERVTAAAQKIATPVKRGAAVMICGAMFCAFGLQAAHGFRKVAITGVSDGDGQSIGAELELFVKPSDSGLGFLYLDTEFVFDGYNILHLSRARGYLGYAYATPPLLPSGGRGYDLSTELSLLGYEYHDFRKQGFNNRATEGFVAQYLSLAELSSGSGFWWRHGFPVFKGSLGGLVSNFEQADLTEWAGDKSDFGAWLWLNTSLNWRFLSLWEALRDASSSLHPPPVDFGIKVEQLRSLFGWIYLNDNDDKWLYYVDDGEFTAIWQAVTADIVWTIFSNKNNMPDKEAVLNLVIEGSLFRQYLNAKLYGGKTFFQDKVGKRLEVKIELKK